MSTTDLDNLREAMELQDSHQWKTYVVHDDSPNKLKALHLLSKHGWTLTPDVKFALKDDKKIELKKFGLNLKLEF